MVRMIKGTYCSEETRQKMSESHKGIPRSEETKRKIGETQKVKYIKENHPNYGKHLSEETRHKISETLKKQILSEEHKQKISKSLKGKYIGENNWNWKDGESPLRKIIQSKFEYRQWRSDVFTRDNFTCQMCGNKENKVYTHHIKSFNSIIQKYEITTLEQAFNCEELWNLNNGITLCEKCHKGIKI